MRRVRLKASREYNIEIGEGLLERVGVLAKELCNAQRALLVCDDKVSALYGERVTKALLSQGFKVYCFVFSQGEQSKSTETLNALLNFAAEKSLCRGDLFIALGGGVTGDLTGFAASCYMRGAPLLQLPTTLLAMVDSAVGGKTAINLKSGKNLVGSFYQPLAVLCDSSVLETLPSERLSEGMAELIKYGAVCDGELLSLLGAGKKPDMQELIERGVKIKAKFVELDERDEGKRRLLNFGHTVGHAAEVLSDFKITHGQAVAVGMCVITRAAVKFHICEPELLRELEELLKKYKLPLNSPFGAELLCKAALSDKKNEGSFINIVLPEKRGLCALHKISHERLRELIKAGTESCL